MNEQADRAHVSVELYFSRGAHKFTIQWIYGAGKGRFIKKTNKTIINK